MSEPVSLAPISPFGIGLPLILIGGGINAYPEYRSLLVKHCFRVGLVPVIPPENERYEIDDGRFSRLIDRVDAYISFLGHKTTSPSAPQTALSRLGAEWQSASTKEKPRLLLIFDPEKYPIEPTMLDRRSEFDEITLLSRKLISLDADVRPFSSEKDFIDKAEIWLSAVGRKTGKTLRPISVESKRKKIFVSYARNDLKENPDWFKPFWSCMDALTYHAGVPYWADRSIRAGEDFNQSIRDEIGSSCAAILLLSQNFFSSAYIALSELPEIRSRGLKQLPILLDHCEAGYLGDIQWLGPSAGGTDHSIVPMSTLDKQRQAAAWAEIQKEIRIRYGEISAADNSEAFGAGIVDAVLALWSTNPIHRCDGMLLIQDYLLFSEDASRSDATPHSPNYGGTLSGIKPRGFSFMEWSKLQLELLEGDQQAEMAAKARALLKRITSLDSSSLRESERARPVAPSPDGSLEQMYLKWVDGVHRWLELPGLRETSAMPKIELDRVFVALRGDRSTAQERLQSRHLLDLEVIEFAKSLDQDPATLDLPTLRRHLLLADEYMPLHREALGTRSKGSSESQTISLGEAFRRDRWLVILGEPGSGKTTLVRWLAQKLASSLIDGIKSVTVPRNKVDPLVPDDGSDFVLGAARLPVLVRISDYAKAKAEKGANYSLDQYLGYQPWQGQHLPESEVPPERLNRLILDKLRSGQAVIMLDGMDEIAHSEQRDEIRGDINRFIEQWINGRGDVSWIGRQSAYLIDGEPWETGGNQIVVTSRIVGYQIAPLEGPVTHVLIEPMAETAVRSFCVAWTKAVHDAIHLAPGSPEPPAVSAEAEAKAIQNAIFDDTRPRTRELATNPLLITILALLYRRGGGLPDQRVDLYRKMIDVLLDDWPVAGIPTEELKAVLPDVAEFIHRTSSSGLVEPGELRPVLAQALTKARHATGALRRDEHVQSESNDINNFLYVALNDVGILAGRGDLLLGFVHLTFQEYLAALWLVRDGDVGVTTARIQNRLDDPRWREPILLGLGYAGSSNGWPIEDFSSLLRALLESDIVVGRGLPRVSLLLVSALEEFPRVVDDVVRSIATQFLDVSIQQARLGDLRPLQEEVDKAFQHLRDHRREIVDRVLIAALCQATGAAAAAALIRRQGWLHAQFAQPLIKASVSGFDQADLDWPIIMALRDFATPALPPALPQRPSPPNPPQLLEEWHELDGRRNRLLSGEELERVKNEIDELLGSLGSPDITGLARDKRDEHLRKLHLTRSSIESGEELKVVSERLQDLSGPHEEAKKNLSNAMEFYADDIARYERDIARYRHDRIEDKPEGKWPLGALSMQRWFRDDRCRRDAILSSPWFPVIIALCGGVKDYRIRKFELAYQAAMNGFQYFANTFEYTREDEILERAKQIDAFDPSPQRWSAGFPIGFSPDFFHRNSPLNNAIIARLEDGISDPAASLKTFLSHHMSEVRVEAALARFASGDAVQVPFPNSPGDAIDATRLTDTKTMLIQLRALHAGWRETLEFSLPKCLPDIRKQLPIVQEGHAEPTARRILWAGVRSVEDPKRRATALWELLEDEPDATVPEMWSEALCATWDVAGYRGYSDGVYDCAIILERAESQTEPKLRARFPEGRFEQLFAEALVPEWAEHPELFSEALHELLRRTPRRLDETFQKALLRGADSLPDVLALWFSVSGRYPLAVVLDTCGVPVPNSEADFFSFARDYISRLPAGRRARAVIRLHDLFPPHVFADPFSTACSLLESIDDPRERLATIDSIVSAMPPNEKRERLAVEAIALVDAYPAGRAKIYMLLRMLTAVPSEYVAAAHAVLDASFDEIDNLQQRADILRGARRWAHVEIQVGALRRALQSLPTEDLRRYGAGLLPTNCFEVARQMSSCAPSEEIALIWTLSDLAVRGEELISFLSKGSHAEQWKALVAEDAEAVDRLLAQEADNGIQLTVQAADAVDWMVEKGRLDLLQLFLPLLERPMQETVGRLGAWIQSPVELLADHAALMMAELGRRIQISTIAHLLRLLNGKLDRSRLRAGVVIHGRSVGTQNVDRLLASKMGADALIQAGHMISKSNPDALPPVYLEPTESEGRLRSNAAILYWMSHQVVFDDPDVVQNLLDRCVTGDVAAGEILKRMEACSGPVLQMITGYLTPEQPLQFQKTLLYCICRILQCRETSYVMKPETGDWGLLAEAVEKWLDNAKPQVLSLPIFSGNAMDIVTAFVPAATEAMSRNGQTAESVDPAGRILSSLERYGNLTPDASWVDKLRKIKIYYRIPEDANFAVRAAEELRKIPERFEDILNSLNALLREDLNDPPMAPLRQQLLEISAAYAQTNPSTVATLALERDMLPLFCRVVSYNKHFRSRADAVLLIGNLRHLTREAAVVLLSALRDVYEVQSAAQKAINGFRFVEQAALDLLLAEMTPDNLSSTAVYGAIKLLASLAAAQSLSSEQRKAVIQVIAGLLQDNDVCRRGVYMLAGSGGKDEKAFWVRFEARLGNVLNSALLRAAGSVIDFRTSI